MVQLGYLDNGVEYFADKIPLNASDLGASSIDGEEYYIVTWTFKGHQYQSDALALDVAKNSQDRYWIKTKEEA